MIKKILNNKGFSIAEVLMSAAIIGVVSSGVMVAMKMTGDSGHNRKKSEIVDRLNKQIITDLKNNATCKAALSSGSASSLSGMAVPSTADISADYKGVGIVSAIISNRTGALAVQKATLTITYNKNPAWSNKKVSGSSIVTKSSVISLRVVGGAIIECSTGFLEDQNLQEACEKSGGNWLLNEIPPRCSVDKDTETVSKCGVLAKSNTGAVGAGAGYQGSAGSGECNADEAYCLDVGNCWENSQCNVPKYGRWMHVGAPECTGCVYQLTSKCIGATCGMGCQGAQPAPQIIENNRPECGTPGQWDPNSPVCVGCDSIVSYSCTIGSCGLGCTTAQTPDVNNGCTQSCDNGSNNCADQAWPAPSFNSTCTNAAPTCSSVTSINCTPGACQTTCSGVDPLCSPSGTSASCTDPSSCTTLGTWELGPPTCTGTNLQSIASYTCSLGCHNGTCPGTQPPDEINENDSNCPVEPPPPTCEELAGVSCEDDNQCGTDGGCVTGGPPSPPPHTEEECKPRGATFPTGMTFAEANCCTSGHQGFPSSCIDGPGFGVGGGCISSACSPTSTGTTTCDADICFCGTPPECPTESGSSSTSSGGCFVAGTQVILESGKSINIEDLKINDKVQASNGEVNEVKTLIRKVYEGELYSINGSKHFVTDDHPFMGVEGWSSFNPEKSRKLHGDLVEKKLEVGKQVVGFDGLRTLLNIHHETRRVNVYNLTVTGSHEYYANGFLVHNKFDKPNCATGQVLNCDLCPEYTWNGETNSCDVITGGTTAARCVESTFGCN